MNTQDHTVAAPSVQLSQFKVENTLLGTLFFLSLLRITFTDIAHVRHTHTFIASISISRHPRDFHSRYSEDNHGIIFHIDRAEYLCLAAEYRTYSYIRFTWHPDIEHPKKIDSASQIGSVCEFAWNGAVTETRTFLPRERVQWLVRFRLCLCVLCTCLYGIIIRSNNSIEVAEVCWSGKYDDVMRPIAPKMCLCVPETCPYYMCILAQ